MANNKKDYRYEYVMVFQSALLRDLGYFNGVSFEAGRYLQAILNPDNYEFMNRSRAETDPAFKQLIPYVIITHDGSVFSYRRGKLMGEKRLHGNRSIGFGGHISVDDPGLFGTTYDEGMKRELHEEVALSGEYTERRVALINDDSNEVGSVHFGVVHVVELSESSIRPREKSINEAHFVTNDDLITHIDEYETWSQICIRNLESLLR